MGKTVSRSRLSANSDYYIEHTDNNRHLTYLVHKNTATEYVLKEIRPLTPADYDHVHTHLSRKMTIKHQHVVPLKDFVIEDDSAAALYEMPFRTLFQQGTQRTSEKIHFQENELWSILASLVLGFSYLQKCGIRHCAVRASNVYVEQSGIIKIADPWLKQEETNYEIMRNQLLPQSENTGGFQNVYLSPSQIQSLLRNYPTAAHNPYKSDVFSLGIMILNLGLLRTQNNFYEWQGSRIRGINHTELHKSVSEFSRLYGEKLTSVVKMMIELEQGSRLDWNQLETFVKQQQEAEQVSSSYQKELTYPNKPPLPPPPLPSYIPKVLPVQVSARATAPVAPPTNLGTPSTSQLNFHPLYSPPPKIPQNNHHHNRSAQHNRSITQQILHTPKHNINSPNQQHILMKTPPIHVNESAKVGGRHNIMYDDNNRKQMGHNPVFTLANRSLSANAKMNVSIPQRNIPLAPKTVAMQPTQTQRFLNEVPQNRRGLSGVQIFSKPPVYNAQQVYIPQGPTIGLAHQLPWQQNQLRSLPRSPPKRIATEASHSSGPGMLGSKQYQPLPTSQPIFATFGISNPPKSQQQQQPVPVSNAPVTLNLQQNKNNSVAPSNILNIISPVPQNLFEIPKNLLSYPYLAKAESEKLVGVQVNKAEKNLKLSIQSINNIHKEIQNKLQEISSALPPEKGSNRASVTQSPNNHASNLLQKQPKPQQADMETTELKAQVIQSQFLGKMTSSQQGYVILSKDYRQMFTETVKNVDEKTTVIKESYQTSPQDRSPPEMNSAVLAQTQQKAGRNIVTYNVSGSSEEMDKEQKIEREPVPQRYQGEIVRGFRHGKGKYYFSDGGWYEGHWSFNRMQGQGSLYYYDGRLAYQGEWKQDHINGKGILYNQFPKVTKIDYHDLTNLRNSWQSFTGNFVMDTKEGEGVIKFCNGDRFEGTFKNQLPEGPGTYTSEGVSVEGIWRKGLLVDN